MKHFLFLLFFIVPFISNAQNFPVSPNKFDENGKRHGHWTELYDTAWKEVRSTDSAKYYRLIRYENGKPSGKVRDFYKNGIKQWDGYLLSLKPDVYDGECNTYYENGKIHFTRTYLNGKWNGYNLEYSILGKLLRRENYKDGLGEGVFTYYEEDGSKKSEFVYSKNLANGPAIFYYPSGQVKSKFILKNDKREGLKEDFYENGKIKARLHYINGLIQNEYEDFYPNGTTDEKGKYKDDKREGPWFENYASGKLMHKGNYKNDLKEGEWFYYFENGNLKKTGSYINDKSEGEWRYYHENGKLQSTAPFKNDKIEGECRIYFEDEKLKSVGHRKNGLAEGEWLTYFPDGKLGDISTYALDSLNGPSAEFYEGGVKKNEGPYSKGLKHGYFRFYYSNGNVKSEGAFVYGKREGFWKFFNEDGSKDETDNYKTGELDGESNFYYPEGSLKQQAFFKSGKVEGVALKYYPSGKLMKREEFANNLTHGKLETFYEDGTPRRLAFFKEGKRHGADIDYYPNGKMKSKDEFLDDISNGVSETYYDNGQLQGRGFAKNGKGEGLAEVYHRNGTMLLKKFFRNGLIEGPTEIYDSLGRIAGKGSFLKNKMHGKWTYFNPRGKKIKEEFYFLGKEETKQLVIDSIDQLTASHDYARALLAVKWLETVVKRTATDRVAKAFPANMYGSVYADADDYEKSYYFYKKYLDVVEKYAAGTVRHKTALHNVGFALQHLKRFAEALIYFDRAIEMAKEFAPSDYWASINSKAACLFDAGDGEKAEQLLDLELDKEKKRYADSVTAWEFRKEVANYFKNRASNYPKAKAMYLSLLNDIHHYGQADHQVAHLSYCFLGSIYRDESEYKLAMSYYDSAIAYEERNKLTAHAQYSENLIGLFLVIKNKDSLSSSRKRQVIEKIKNATQINVDHQLLARLYKTLQVYEYDMSDYQKSINYGKRAMEEVHQARTENSLTYSNILQTQAWNYYYSNKKDYSIGESLFEEALAIRKKLYGESSDNYYLSKMVLGTFYRSISKLQKAEQTLNEVLPLLKAAHLLESIANVESALGEVYYDQGKYTLALPHLEAALSFFEANHKEFPYYYLDVLKLLASSYQGLDKYEPSISFAKKAYDYAVELDGKTSLMALRRLEALAGVYQSFNFYTEAQKYYQQVADAFKLLNGENSDVYLYALINLATVYRQQGERQKSIDLLLPYFKKLDSQPSSAVYLSVVTELAEASAGPDEEIYRRKKLSCYKDLYGEDNYNYAKYLNELGGALSKQYRMEEAEILMTNALKIVNRTDYGKTYLARDFYSLLARLKSDLDKNKEAEELFLESVAITAKDTLNSPVSYELSCEDLSGFYSKMGRYADSEKVLRKTIALVERKEGKTFYYHRTRWNLAMTLLNQERSKEAYDLCSDVAKTVEDEFGVNNWLSLSAHNTLGIIAMRQKDFTTAKSEFLKCLHGYESRKQPTQIDQSWIESSNFNVAVTSIGLGQLKEAEVRLSKSDSVRKKFSITSINSYEVKLLRTRAIIAEEKKDFQKAEEYWNQLLRRMLDYTNTNFYYMSDEEKAQFWKDQGNIFRQFQSFAVRRAKQNPIILGAAYNVQLATKAILLSSSNKIRKRIFSSNDTAMVNMYYRWQQKRDRLAQLYATPAGTPEYTASVDSLKILINRIEKELNIAAEDLEEDKGGKLVDWKEVQRSLKPNEAAVEIIRYKNYDRFERDSIIYAALVLTAETKTAPELVILPDGKMLEGRALKFYKNAIAAQIEDKSSYQFYWADIGQKLKNKTRLYLSLDGVYNSINLNTLRDTEGNFIVDSKNITLLANTKDLLSLKGKRRASSAGASASLVGFPTYFLGKEKIKKSMSKQRDFDFSKLSDEDRSGIAELPGTKTEIEKVNSILKSHHWQVASHTDEAATEETVKEIRQPKLVHIATHGYFTNDVSTTATNTDPMLRAGLLFTGAANFLQDQISTTSDNGILTAYEAANLNLDNTDLVVLSACETGKGEVQNGEGVYGLQRAFQTAGAHAIIMSLWKVDDEATQELMTSFYQNWMSGTEKAEAFRQAQLQLKNKFNHPYYWGAFVMMGN